MDDKGQPSHRTTVVSGLETEKPSLSNLPFEQWDRYQVLHPLGEGGTATVYKAFDVVLNRHVALKFLWGEDLAEQKRFLHEARAQAQIEHDHICKIYEVGTFSGKHYIAMQFIDGESLEKAAAKMTVEEKCRMMQQVSEAVHTAHRVGIIHRDLKPGNIMVERTETGLRPYVLDFGLARQIALPGITMKGLVIGTPSYMSPEQAWGNPEALDRRTDVYSLGATMYRMFSGRPPYDGNTMEVIFELANKDPIPLRKISSQIPFDLETIVMKCLEREPHRRYDSARAVSEELGRYLSGDPILARPPALFYRIGRKAKKHKVFVTAAALSMVLILLFLGLWIQSRFQAGRQALLAQQLGQEVQRMEGSLRSIYMLPLHDVRAEKAAVRQQMEQIIQRIGKQAGEIGNAPVYYATGRVYFALQEYEKAKIHLEKAWNSGYKTPDVTYVLGLVLGSLYQRELQQIERLENPAGKEAARLRIDRQYRVPALKYLKESHGIQVESIDYANALLSFYEKNYDVALVHASNAFRKIPWLYESKILIGNIYQEKGYQELILGNYEGAMENFHRAEDGYLAASKIGESDVRGYEGSCSVWNNLLHIGSITKVKTIPELLKRAIQSCEQALKADPDRAEVHSQIAKMYWLSASQQSSVGQDPHESIAKSLSASNKAVELDPQNVLSLATLGITHWEQGKWDMTTGKDPTNSFQSSITILKKAVAIDPTNITAQNALGVSYMELGNYEMDLGKDPRPPLQEASQCFRKTLESNPKSINPIVNLGITYYLMGRYELDHGKNPLNSFQQASSALKKATEIRPNLTFNYRFLVSTNTESARYHTLLGTDNDQSFKQAQEYFAKGIHLNPTDEPLYYEGTKLYLARSLFALDQNRSPLEDLNQARQLAQKALTLNPSASWNYHNLAQAVLIEAQWKVLNKEDPSTALVQLRDFLPKAIQISGKSAITDSFEAEANYWQARWNLIKRRDIGPLVQKGLVIVESALKMTSGFPELYALRGRFYLLKAASNQDTQERMKDATSARDDFRKTLSLNSNLQKQYSADLAQAEKLIH